MRVQAIYAKRGDKEALGLIGFDGRIPVAFAAHHQGGTTLADAQEQFLLDLVLLKKEVAQLTDAAAGIVEIQANGVSWYFNAEYAKGVVEKLKLYVDRASFSKRRMYVKQLFRMFDRGTQTKSAQTNSLIRAIKRIEDRFQNEFPGLEIGVRLHAGAAAQFGFGPSIYNSDSSRVGASIYNPNASLTRTNNYSDFIGMLLEAFWPEVIAEMEQSWDEETKALDLPAMSNEMKIAIRRGLGPSIYKKDSALAFGFGPSIYNSDSRLTLEESIMLENTLRELGLAKTVAKEQMAALVADENPIKNKALYLYRLLMNTGTEAAFVQKVGVSAKETVEVPAGDPA